MILLTLFLVINMVKFKKKTKNDCRLITIEKIFIEKIFKKMTIVILDKSGRIALDLVEIKLIKNN